MIADFTLEQLKALSVPAHRPLLICDVDEVVVHFTRAFEDYIGGRNYYLDTSSFALNGNIRENASGLPMADEAVGLIIDDFFVDCTAHLRPIDGAVAALHTLADQATVVMLTNLPHHARDKRLSNMRDLGVDFPVVTNSGPKGPAIRHLATQTTGPVVFVDDSPGFIASSFRDAPDVHLVHFLQDERFARHLTPYPYVSLTTGTWDVALPHIQGLLR